MLELAITILTILILVPFILLILFLLNFISFRCKALLLELIALYCRVLAVGMERALHLQNVFKSLRPAIPIRWLHGGGSIIWATLMSRLLPWRVLLLVPFSILLFAMSTLLIITIALLARKSSLRALYKIDQVLHMDSKIFNILWKIPVEILILPSLPDPFRKELKYIIV